MDLAAEVLQPTLVGVVVSLFVAGIGFLSLYVKRTWSNEDDVSGELRKEMERMEERHDAAAVKLEAEIDVLRRALARVVPTIDDHKVRAELIGILVRSKNGEESPHE